LNNRPFPESHLLLIQKNQVMKKIKLLTRDENVQAGLVIAGFILVFSLLALFFMGK